MTTSKTEQEIMPDLEAQRTELTEKLGNIRLSDDVAELVRRADEAVNNFKAEVAGHEHKIDEIDAQIGSRERTRREEAARQQRDQRDALRKALLEEEEQQLAAFDEAQKSLRAFRANVETVLAHHERKAHIARELSAGKKVPMVLNRMELLRRIGGRICSELSQIKDCRIRIGSLELKGGDLYPPDRSWRAEEEKLMAAQLIQPLLEGKL